MKFHFYLKYHTHFGESLWIAPDINRLPGDETAGWIAMQYLDPEYWHALVEIPFKEMEEVFRYKYVLKNEKGELFSEWGFEKYIPRPEKNIKELHIIDRWNHPGSYENVFYTAPFKNVWLKPKAVEVKTPSPKKVTHIFRVKAPLLQPDETVCLLGNGKYFNNWSTDHPCLMARNGDWYELKLNLSKQTFPLEYKYGVYNNREKKFIRFESGHNRILTCPAGKKRQTLLHDGFVQLPNNTWKGAGVCIPVFSLRSKKSGGCGEFTDIRLLADWASQTGIKLIQLLPVNDTSARFTDLDSYPYAAISVYALHPIYLNLSKTAGKKHAAILKPYVQQLKQLNEKPTLEYQQVMQVKLEVLKMLYPLMQEDCFRSGGFREFFEENKHWLVPYAAFCFFRDKYGTADFTRWGNDSQYLPEEIERISLPDSPHYAELGFHYFVQYQLHVQLMDAVAYAHRKGVVLKGDLPIGVSRYSCEVWTSPQLFDLSNQLGAPPDDFTTKGQNWSFPAYNWKRMREDGLEWWKNRFHHLSRYFDALRIDHILGFFRTWNIPDHAVEGIMGRFEPAVPVHSKELQELGIWPDEHRFCQPYIDENVLHEQFGSLAEKVRKEFLQNKNEGSYQLKPEFATQRQVKEFFEGKESSEENSRLREGLYNLISNVILFEEKDNPDAFHFRISMEKTSSFASLIPFVQEKLRHLYIDYFYRRQDELWKKEAMWKLPLLKSLTDMLICGEDLGMIPAAVPEVMKHLGVLSLEIQRMHKKQGVEFFHPGEAPYLSVVSPSTHDMSTIRGWWEEDPQRSQRFFNTMLGQPGEAPPACEAWINRAIVLQHLYSPAMWCIFLLQDMLGMSEELRRPHPQEERINVPADAEHIWNYRMHLPLEELKKEKAFNETLKKFISDSGR